MNAKQILNGLDGFHEGIPHQLLLEAVKKKNEITPGLIAAVEEIANNPDTFLNDPERNLYYWATYLLAHFEEERALPAIVKMFRLKGQNLEPVIDLIIEDGAMILANMSGPNIEPIVELLQDQSVESDSRVAAADALGLLAAWEAADPARVKDEFCQALQNIVEPDSFLAGTIVNAAMELNLRELAPEITKAFDRKIVTAEDFELAAEWLHDPDFVPLPPYLHLVQKIDDIVEFFEEKAALESGLGDAELT